MAFNIYLFHIALYRERREQKKRRSEESKAPEEKTTRVYMSTVIQPDARRYKRQLTNTASKYMYIMGKNIRAHHSFISFSITLQTH